MDLSQSQRMKKMWWVISSVFGYMIWLKIIGQNAHRLHYMRLIQGGFLCPSFRLFSIYNRCAGLKFFNVSRN